jgi:hypothetical protein
MEISIKFEEQEGIDGSISVPQRMLIYFGRGLIPWELTYLYFPYEGPFRRAGDIDYEKITLQIISDDLVLSHINFFQIGIHLPTIIKRIERVASKEKIDIDLLEIEQFSIWMNDLRIIRQYDIFYKEAFR